MKGLYPDGVGEELERSARSLQAWMRERYRCGITRQDPVQVRTIAGADAAYAGDYGIGVVVLLSYPSLGPIGYGYAIRPILFPYIPGLLAFRELPLIMAAFEKITEHPDLLIVDGHGYAHPVRFGYACHAGAVLGIPTIGVAKRPMCGQGNDPGNETGMYEEWVMDGEVTGTALRTKSGASPVYVSAGYKTSLRFSCKIILETTRDHRICEPIRIADLIARKLRRLYLQST
ncbi:MAG: endonuclease V [Methanoregulaceae archaeon]|nr:endonuclease V [Methanoregulaceae archaeon]